MVKFILYLVMIWWISRIVFKFLFGESTSRRFTTYQYRGRNAQQTPNNSGNQDKFGGEYVDYEEVK